METSTKASAANSAEQPILAHLLPLAQRAYYWSSFNPKRRGESTVNDYSAELSADIESIKDAAAKNTDVAAEKHHGEFANLNFK